MSHGGFWDFLHDRHGPYEPGDDRYFAVLLLAIGALLAWGAAARWRQPVDVLTERRMRADVERTRTLPRLVEGHIRAEEGWLALYNLGGGALAALVSAVLILTGVAFTGPNAPAAAFVVLPAGMAPFLIHYRYPRIPEWMVPPRRRALWRLRLAQDARNARPYRLRRNKPGRVLPPDDEPATPITAYDPVGPADRPWRRRHGPTPRT